MQLVQVALSCRDLLATRRWYADCFGYLPAGEFDSEAYPEPSVLAALQDLPAASFRVVWAVDAQEFFQLELFQYRAPEARPLPAGVAAVRRRLHDTRAPRRGLRCRAPAPGRAGTQPLAPPLGAAGARRACVRDPDGVLVEVMEDNPAGTPSRAAQVATRFVRASVLDLDRSLAHFVDTLGLERHEPTLHGPEHEALWGLEGATRRVELLSAGDFWVELAQYEDPRPAPWPDGYRISDLGILNVALGSRNKQEYGAVLDAVRAAGARVNPENDVGYGSFVYTMDDQGFSVELMYLDRAADAGAGFAEATA